MTAYYVSHILHGTGGSRSRIHSLTNSLPPLYFLKLKIIIF